MRMTPPSRSAAIVYIRPQHREDRIATLHEAIENIRFGTLITIGAEGPMATHIPMFVRADPQPYGLIVGHIARQNPQWQKSLPDKMALATCVGEHAYISPSLYETRTTTGKVVPTWMYLAVQALGPIEFFDDGARLLALVSESTRAQEHMRDNPWSVEEAPSEYIEGQLRAIVGFELRVKTIEGAWKFSQRKRDGDREGVVSGLLAEDQPELSALVRDHP